MKAKYKISQLAAVDTKDLNIIHPKFGDIGLVVTLGGRNHPQWKAAVTEYMASDRGDEATAKLTASGVVAWNDDEAMEGACTIERVTELMANPAYEWWTLPICDALNDNATFFPDIS